MAENYNILQWYEYFVKSKDAFDIKTDTKEGSSVVLYPGRFYILNYKSKTDKRYNSRPVIISLGLSEKDPNSYLCIDLCVMPLKVRLKFIETYFKYKGTSHNGTTWEVSSCVKRTVPLTHASRRFHEKIREWVRIEDACGPEALKHQEHQKQL